MELQKPWYVYIVRCNDGSLYTGISPDFRRRITAHNKGAGAKYTKIRRPVVLVYSETCLNRSEAMKREREIKRWDRSKKLQLILGGEN